LQHTHKYIHKQHTNKLTTQRTRECASETRSRSHHKDIKTLRLEDLKTLRHHAAAAPCKTKARAKGKGQTPHNITQHHRTQNTEQRTVNESCVLLRLATRRHTRTASLARHSPGSPCGLCVCSFICHMFECTVLSMDARTAAP
jgi:hypothetical protein